MTPETAARFGSPADADGVVVRRAGIEALPASGGLLADDVLGSTREAAGLPTLAR